ncbi:MAG: GNAT family N-acetyltransferase [Bdellovibrionota bacterium]|nr:GNAT family N-acetyltransferase [Bdellovibrionota bacterium]
MSTFFKGLSKFGLLAHNYSGADFLESENWPEGPELMKVCEFDRAHFPFPWSIESWMETQISPKNYLLSTFYDQSGILKAFSLWRVSREEGLLHLLKIVVGPGMRRRGLGETLLQETVKMAGSHGMGRFYLEVEEGNFGAIRLYEKLGFNKLHLTKNFYGKSRNCLKMLKSLK